MEPFWKDNDRAIYNCDGRKTNFLPDNYIDIANASSLFDSPQVFQRIKNSAPLSQHGFYTSKHLKDILISQLERVVKSEGFFIYDGEL